MKWLIFLLPIMVAVKASALPTPCDPSASNSCEFPTRDEVINMATKYSDLVWNYDTVSDSEQLTCVQDWLEGDNGVWSEMSEAVWDEHYEHIDNVYDLDDLYIGMAYSFGDWDTPESFINGIEDGKEAGTCGTGTIRKRYRHEVTNEWIPSWEDDKRSCSNWGARLSCAVGIDCSGFISRVWNFRSKRGTGYSSAHPEWSLQTVSSVIDWEQARKGDIFMRNSYHVQLYAFTDSKTGQPYIYDSSATHSGVHFWRIDSFPDNTNSNVPLGSRAKRYYTRRLDVNGETLGDADQNPEGTIDNPIDLDLFNMQNKTVHNDGTTVYAKDVSGDTKRGSQMYFDFYWEGLQQHHKRHTMQYFGPEIIYTFTLPEDGWFKASLIDLNSAEHTNNIILLRDLSIKYINDGQDTVALSTIDVGTREIDNLLPPGTYYLVVDALTPGKASFDQSLTGNYIKPSQAGAFNLSVEFKKVNSNAVFTDLVCNEETLENIEYIPCEDGSETQQKIACDLVWDNGYEYRWKRIGICLNYHLYCEQSQYGQERYGYCKDISGNNIENFVQKQTCELQDYLDLSSASGSIYVYQWEDQGECVEDEDIYNELESRPKAGNRSKQIGTISDEIAVGGCSLILF